MNRRPPDGLWSRYLAARDDPDAGLDRARLRYLRALRDRLVAHYTPLAARAARRAAPKPPAPFDADDVVSWGMAGLLDAVETFEPDRGARFETYAFGRARWRVLDELRKADPLPRSARSKARRGGRQGEPPADPLPSADRGRGRRVPGRATPRDPGPHPPGARVVRPASLDAPLVPSGSTIPEAGPGLHALLADPTDDPQAALDRSEARERVTGALDALDERTRLVVTAYFYRGMKLREIGAELGLTEGRISQIMRAALDALREDRAA